MEQAPGKPLGEKSTTGILREQKGEATEHAGKVVGVSGSLVSRAKFVAENSFYVLLCLAFFAALTR